MAKILGNGFLPQLRRGGLYLLRDEFTTDRAAGAVNGTSAEPGPGVRNVVDGSNNLSIASGYLARAGGSLNNPVMRYAAPRSRVGGVILRAVFPASGVNIVGYSATLDVSASDGGYVSGANLRITAPGIDFPVASVSYPVTTFYITRASGGFLFYGIILVGITTSGSSALNVHLYSTIVGNISDSIRMPTVLWLPTPLASDGFASAFGTTDGLGHAETSGVGSGGSGLTWTQQAGTWTVASNRASASALSGGIAIATVPTSTADVLAECKVTRSAGQGGLLLRYTDANNYLYANHDGTNCFIKQVLAGSTTTLVTAAAVYSANAIIRVDLSGVNGRLYYNNTLVGSTASINAALTATAHGLYVTDVTANLTVDDFVVYAKGTAGEYAVLDLY